MPVLAKAKREIRKELPSLKDSTASISTSSSKLWNALGQNIQKETKGKMPFSKTFQKDLK